MSDKDKIQLYAKIIRHQIAVFSLLFELITGVKPPKLQKVLGLQ